MTLAALWPHTPAERAALAALLLAYLLLAAAFAALTPAWQNPDEPAHYNYAAQVARAGCCPVIEPGDWDSAYLDELKAARFAPERLAQLDTIQYEDHQPPLYYLLAAPVHQISGGSLLALRLFSALLGAGVVICAYLTARAMLPERLAVALGAAALVAFLPQHLAMMASANNDALAGLLIGVGLLLAVLHVKGARVPAWALGLAAGLIFITKASGYPTAAVLLLALVLRHRRGALPHMAAFLIPALGLGALWWLRNLGVYGFPDFLGLAAHDRVVIGQPRTADAVAAVGLGQHLLSGLQTTFNSFWGQFGWMALPLPGWMYRLFQAAIAAGLVGLAAGRFALPRSQPPPGQRQAWLLLGLTLALALLAFVYYNTEFVQFQGRYLYPALIPFALLLALGVDNLGRWLLPHFAPARWLAPALFALLAPLNAYLLVFVIRPLLAP